MALSPSGMFLFEKALSLTPKEWMHLRHWMFSTTYHDAGLGDDRVPGQLPRNSDVTSQQATNTSTAKDGKETTSATASIEHILGDPNQIHGPSLDFLTSQRAQPPSHGGGTATETYQDAATNITNKDIPAVKDITFREESAGAPARPDRLTGRAERTCEATSAVRHRGTAVTAVGRKRIKKQLGVHPLVEDGCVGLPPRSDSRHLKTKQACKTSASATPNGNGAFYTAAPSTFRAGAAARQEALGTAGCWSEIVEEHAGMWRVSVRKGNACITKHFSPADRSDRLPELMLHIRTGKTIPSASAATTESGTSVLASGRETGVAITAEKSQEVANNFSTATGTTGAVSIGKGISKTPSVSTQSYSHESIAGAYEGNCTTRSQSYASADSSIFLDPQNATAATRRAEASAQLYCEWVCKHFEQVHHYLNTSKCYLQPDAKSRETAASLALHMLLNLPQDAEQQRYLQWITSFLNASNSAVSAVPLHTYEELRRSQGQNSADVPLGAAAPVAAPSSTTPQSVSLSIPQSALGAPHPGKRLRGAGVPVPSPTVRSSFPKSCSSSSTSSVKPRLCDVVSSYATNPRDSRPSEEAGCAATTAAQLLESLCLRGPAENNYARCEAAQRGSRDTFTLTPSGASGASNTKSMVVDSSKGEAARAISRGLSGHVVDRFHVALSRDQTGVRMPAAVAASPQAPCTDTQSAAGTCATAGIATANEFADVRETNSETAASVGLLLASTIAAAMTTPSVVSAAVTGAPVAEIECLASTADRIDLATPDAVSNAEKRGEHTGEVATIVSDTGAASQVAHIGGGSTGAADSSLVSSSSAGTAPLASPAAVPAPLGGHAREATSDLQGALVSLVANTAVGSGITVSTDSCDVVLKDFDAAQMDLGSKQSEAVLVDQEGSAQPASQHGCNAPLPEGGELSAELMEAARALVGSLSQEKEAMIRMDHNSFSRILEMLQAALEDSGTDAQQQHLELHPLHAQVHAVEDRDIQLLSLVDQPKERSDYPRQELEGSSDPQYQQHQHHQTPPCHTHLRKQLQTPHPEDQHTKQQHVETPHQQTEKQEHLQEPSAEISRVLEAFALQPEPSGALGQRQALKVEGEQSADLDGGSSITTLLYSLLQKRLPPATEAIIYQKDGLLRETSLCYNDTDCSSQNSRKVSSCAEESPMQASNSFTSHATGSVSASGDSSHQPTLQTVSDTYESASANGSGAFPCFLEEYSSLPAAELSGSACAASSTSGDVYWPSRDSTGHLKQEPSTQKEESIPSNPGFDLVPAEKTVRRRDRAAMFGSHATAATAVG